MPKNEKDYAVIVGIKNYPAFDASGPLEGPENDALAFKDWVVSEAGGNIPNDSEHLSLIVSSQYATPASPENAQPMVNDVQRAFERLQDKAEKNAQNGKGLQVGRRLYIFMAGHGFAPRDDQVGLLMANATPTRTGAVYHVLGKYTADWFFKAKYFKEILLFMDCCREPHPVMGLNMSFNEAVVPGAIDTVKRFYGYATNWSRLSREKKIGEVRRGIFTVTLLNGLSGGATDPATGELTAQSLSDYLYTNMRHLLDESETKNVEIPKEPDIDFFPKTDNGFLITHTPVPSYNVSINIPAASIGKPGRILNGSDLTEVVTEPAVTNPWVILLKRGKYLAEVVSDGLRKVINVDGNGDVRESF